MQNPHMTRLRALLPLLGFFWLAALAGVVVLVPVFTPGDGLVWRPGPTGLVIHKIAQTREVTFAPGQRIVYFNGTSWESTTALHQNPAFYPLTISRISYEIREEEWKLRRQVLQAPLPFSASLAAYWQPAACLLFLAIVALGQWRGRWRLSTGTGSLAAIGTGLAVWTVANQNLTLLTFSRLRHLEATALLFAFGLGALLRRWTAPGNRFANALPWILVTAVALSWEVMTDRWLWWSTVQWALATLGAVTFAVGSYDVFFRSRD